MHFNEFVKRDSTKYSVPIIDIHVRINLILSRSKEKVSIMNIYENTSHKCNIYIHNKIFITRYIAVRPTNKALTSEKKNHSFLANIHTTLESMVGSRKLVSALSETRTGSRCRARGKKKEPELRMQPTIR